MSGTKFGGAPSEKCVKCGKTVYVAEMAKMEGQIWHIECLRCVEPTCNKKLSGANWGGFVPPDNQPYCSLHHKRLRQASGSAVEFSGSTTNSKWRIKAGEGTNSPATEGGAAAPAEGGSEGAEGGEPKPVAEKPAVTPGKPGESCVKCGGRVYPAECVKMEGQLWHENCLRCADESGCNKKLSGANWGGFIPPDNKPYCDVHHKRLRQASGSAVEFSGSTTNSKWKIKAGEGSGEGTPTEGGAASPSAAAKPRWGGAPSEKCTKCGKTVYNAEMVKMEGQIWHDNCLRCVEPTCNKKLAGANWGGFVPPDNSPYCKVHHGRLIAASGSAVAISGSTTNSKWKVTTGQ